MAVCNPSELLESAKCFSCLGEKELDMVAAQLLREWSGSDDSPSDLMTAASCFQCLDTKQLEMVQAQLLCDING